LSGAAPKSFSPSALLSSMPASTSPGVLLKICP
jgi:hypothetical protein